ncbi:zinc-ribbon domain-containing protein [Gracilibacillus ureilyticus]|uniref:Zinc-ribbon domain-containing protein n=1 Tax=Gracilibacillus ureilyticus TaxID=531814 RepID=A0A1H9QVM8_9BACI|nr:trypsin-like peptidase domain-containing protein [Gracilibacillus ureilyticus]SER64651.1 zinc-ribbon domain-containing protein [Gracilibacillus ureilyticus]
MYCQKCGNQIEQRAKYCPRCGKPIKKKSNGLLITTIIFLSAIAAVVLYFVGTEYKELQLTKTAAIDKSEEEQEIVATDDNPEEESPVEEETAKDKIIDQSKASDREVADIITDAQTRVFTIFSDYGQGSGFLINDFGDVMTNAHVVEGSFYVTVKGSEGTEYDGYLIGYSNDTDIAIIRVESLAGKTPLSLEVTEKSVLGDEVIALGSPHGYEKTATLGNISGVDRTFTIEPHYYEEVYQISAPIAPGSSGGPLLDQSTEKVIGINSARHDEEATIGFSIPLYQITPLMDEWVSNPMGEDEIYSLFYNQNGDYFYDDLYDGTDSYFDGGYYDDSESYYYYDTYTDTYYFYDPYEDEYYYYDENLDDFYYYEDEYYSDDYYEEYYNDDYYYEDGYYEEDYYYEDGYYDEEYYYEDDIYYDEDYYENEVYEDVLNYETETYNGTETAEESSKEEEVFTEEDVSESDSNRDSNLGDSNGNEFDLDEKNELEEVLPNAG